MSNATYADSESESFERICFAEKVYLVTVVTLECIKCQIPSAGHLLCWGRIKFTGVREQSHRRAAWKTQEVSGQEEVLVLRILGMEFKQLGKQSKKYLCRGVNLRQE